MPQIVKNPITKVVQIEGENKIHVSIDPIVIELNLNVTSEGLAVTAQAKVKEEEEAVGWVLPKFGGKKIKFGKSGE